MSLNPKPLCLKPEALNPKSQPDTPKPDSPAWRPAGEGAEIPKPAKMDLWRLPSLLGGFRGLGFRVWGV